MSSDRLPPVTFKNTLEKQQIAHRMHNHRKKVHQLQLKKPKQINSDAELTYKTLHEDNPKKIYYLQNKYTEIQRENRILFEKISHISKKKKKSQSQRMDRAKSLNITFRKKQIEQIQIANAKMFNRILQQKAFISFKNTDKQFLQTKRMSDRISMKRKYKLEDWY